MLLPAWVAALAIGIAVAASCPAPVAASLLVLALAAAAWRMLRRRPASSVAALALASGIVLGLRALPPPLAPVEAAPPPTREVLARVLRGPDAEDPTGTRAR